MKEFIRRIVWYFCEAFMLDGEFVCEPGTLKYRFFNWLYGDGEQLSDGWEYPEKERTK